MIETVFVLKKVKMQLTYENVIVKALAQRCSANAYLKKIHKTPNTATAMKSFLIKFLFKGLPTEVS